MLVSQSTCSCCLYVWWLSLKSGGQAVEKERWIWSRGEQGQTTTCMPELESLKDELQPMSASNLSNEVTSRICSFHHGASSSAWPRSWTCWGRRFGRAGAAAGGPAAPPHTALQVSPQVRSVCKLHQCLCPAPVSPQERIRLRLLYTFQFSLKVSRDPG